MDAATRSRGMGLKRLLERALTGRTKKPAKAAADSTAGSRYRGVQVHAGSACCEAAREIQGRRFLSNEVPPLPLPDCDAAHCDCRYELFADRRSDTRRQADRNGDSGGAHRNGRRDGDRPG